VTAVIVTGTLFVGMRGLLNGEEIIPLPAISLEAMQAQRKGHLVTSVSPQKTISAGVFTDTGVSRSSPTSFIYPLNNAFLPPISGGISNNQTQWSWQLAAATFAANNINAELAHLEQRIAGDMLHMLKLVFAVGAVVIAVVILGGVLVARHVAWRMVSNSVAPEMTDHKNPLCHVTQVDENTGSSEATLENTQRAAVLNVTSVEEGSQLISDSEMTLEVILTAMQQVGDAVAEMTMSHSEQIKEATPSVHVSREMAPMAQHDTCELENRTANDALEDQALTLRRLMTFFASHEGGLSEQESILDTYSSSESDIVTTASTKTVSTCSLH
jgi:hypothetical protein